MSPDDDGYIGYVLSDVARLIRTVFDRRVRSLGLTRAQWLVLSRLYRRPGTSQTELADMLEVDRASAGRMIDEGTAPNAASFRQFEPVPGPGGKLAGLKFVFPPYQVGPYSDGVQSVQLPASALLPLIAPEYRDLFATQ